MKEVKIFVEENGEVVLKDELGEVYLLEYDQFGHGNHLQSVRATKFVWDKPAQ